MEEVGSQVPAGATRAGRKEREGGGGREGRSSSGVRWYGGTNLSMPMRDQDVGERAVKAEGGREGGEEGGGEAPGR